jgi:hypothetical protein
MEHICKVFSRGRRAQLEDLQLELHKRCTGSKETAESKQHRTQGESQSFSKCAPSKLAHFSFARSPVLAQPSAASTRLATHKTPHSQLSHLQGQARHHPATAAMSVTAAGVAEMSSHALGLGNEDSYVTAQAATASGAQSGASSAAGLPAPASRQRPTWQQAMSRARGGPAADLGGGSGVYPTVPDDGAGAAGGSMAKSGWLTTSALYRGYLPPTASSMPPSAPPPAPAAAVGQDAGQTWADARAEGHDGLLRGYYDAAAYGVGGDVGSAPPYKHKGAAAGGPVVVHMSRMEAWARFSAYEACIQVSGLNRRRWS